MDRWIENLLILSGGLLEEIQIPGKMKERGSKKYPKANVNVRIQNALDVSIGEFGVVVAAKTSTNNMNQHRTIKFRTKYQFVIRMISWFLKQTNKKKTYLIIKVQIFDHSRCFYTLIWRNFDSYLPCRYFRHSAGARTRTPNIFTPFPESSSGAGAGLQSVQL